MSATGSPRASSQTDDFMERVLCVFHLKKDLKELTRVELESTILHCKEKKSSC